MGFWTNVFKEGLLGGTTLGISLVVIQEYIGGIVFVHGPSMQPTIKTNDVLITDEISPRLGRIKKGDVVIARSPQDFSRICKRVVAESGDTVTYKGHQIKVPGGHVWLEGDNKDDSKDSRDWGPLPMAHLRRRCWMKVWPQFDMLTSDKVYAAAATHAPMGSAK